MGVKIQYKGYHLEFSRYPAQEQILGAYEDLRRAVLSRMRQADNISIPRTGRNDELPLSLIQESMWLQEQLYPQSGAYNLPAAIRLQGNLDISALERSLGEVVRRHEILRTRFQLVDGRPTQAISPPQALTLPLMDFSVLDPEAREKAVEEAVSREVGQAFDVENGPLFRGRLLSLGAQEHVFLLTTHHIVSDGWSAGILLRELAALYETYSRGGTSPFPELPLQYADYAKWQRNQLTGETVHQALDYWRQHLAGAPALLDLPTDFPRPPRLDPQGSRHFFHLPANMTARLKKLARQQDVTLFTLLLTAFQVQLAKISRREDIVIGTPVAGRVRPELEKLIGCFINTLAVRTSVRAHSHFSQVLHGVQNTLRQTLAFQEFPFEKVIEALAPKRNPAYTPVYQVLFDFVNTPPRTVELSSLTMSPLAANTGAVKMDLLFDMWETNEELAGQIEYRTSLFKPETIASWARSFVVLLENIVTTPDARIADLETLSQADRLEELAARNEQKKRDRHRFNSVRPKAIKL